MSSEVSDNKQDSLFLHIYNIRFNDNKTSFICKYLILLSHKRMGSQKNETICPNFRVKPFLTQVKEET